MPQDAESKQGKQDRSDGTSPAAQPDKTSPPNQTQTDPGRGVGEMGFESQDPGAPLDVPRVPLDVGESGEANESSPPTEPKTQSRIPPATNEQSRG